MMNNLKNKRGQVESIIIFIGFVVAIFILSIIILRITNEILTPFANTLAPISNQSATVVNSIHNSFASVWDWIIILLFIFNILILFYSSFMVDTHPVFLVIYIIAIMFLVIFGNTFAYIIDAIWGEMAGPVELAQTPMQQFIINNFNIIMLGVIGLSGIIMYSKLKRGNGGSGF